MSWDILSTKSWNQTVRGVTSLQTLVGVASANGRPLSSAPVPMSDVWNGH